MSENKVSLKFIGFEKDADHVEYKILAKDSQDETWQLTARYSTLRQIYRDLRDVTGIENLPDFPPKKYFGAMSDNFITQRQKALENFFNILLKKHRFDELGSLKEFVESNKQDPKKTDKPNNQTGGVNTNAQNNANAIGKKAEKDRLINLEKVIGNFKNEFFDLNDTLDLPDEEQIRKRKGMYNFKLEIAIPKDVYDLPAGNESNLINIQDKTLTSINPSISTLLWSTLEEIREDIKKIKLHSDVPIVVILD